MLAELLMSVFEQHVDHFVNQSSKSLIVFLLFAVHQMSFYGPGLLRGRCRRQALPYAYCVPLLLMGAVSVDWATLQLYELVSAGRAEFWYDSHHSRYHSSRTGDLALLLKIKWALYFSKAAIICSYNRNVIMRNISLHEYCLLLVGDIYNAKEVRDALQNCVAVFLAEDLERMQSYEVEDQLGDWEAERD